MSRDENPYGSPQRAPASRVRHGSLVLVMAWAVIAATAGGFACGLLIDRFSELGGISFWAMGALAGYVAHRFLGGQGRLVGFALVAGCLCAFAIAETCWIHWNTKQGAESWLAAFALLPTFVKEYEIAALSGAIFTAFGAWSAYRQTATSCRPAAVDGAE